MNNEEALGTAGEAAAIGAAGAGAPVLSGALFGGSNAMQNNQNVGGVLTEAGIGAVAGKALDVAAPYISKVAGAIIPEGVKTAVSALVDKATPLLDKIVPDAVTSGTLKDAVETYAPNIGKLFMSSAGQAGDEGLSAWGSGQVKITALRSTLGQEMDDLSGALTDQFPEAKITLTASQVQAYKAAAEKAGIALPEFMNTASTVSAAGQDVTAEIGEKIASVDLDISQAQKLGSAFNQGNAYQKSYVQSVAQDLRQRIINQLNDSHAGLGTVFGQMYETASTGYQALDSIDNIFNTKGEAVNSTDIKGYIKTLQDQINDPTQKPILQQILSKVKTSTGLDLSSKTNAVASAAKIKDPILRRAAKATINLLAKNVGWIGAAVGLHEHLF